MKKIHRKGFTLVELLVVLVLIAIIMTIAIPSVTSSIERSKEKQKNSKIELIESAAELYIDRHKNSLASNASIKIKDLICDDLLSKEQAKDPFNESYTLSGYYSRSNDKWVEVSNNNTYRLKIDENLTC